jgi:hypothetical protein
VFDRATLTRIISTSRSSRWSQAKWITQEPFVADDFIKGRKLDMCFVPVGLKGTKERENFLLTNFAPAFAAYSLMRSPRRKLYN